MAELKDNEEPTDEIKETPETQDFKGAAGRIEKKHIKVPEMSKKNMLLVAILAVLLISAGLVLSKINSKPGGLDEAGQQTRAVKEVPLEFTLENATGKEWPNVVMTVKGDVDFGFPEPLMAFDKQETEDGIFHKFQVGTIKPGETKKIRIVAKAKAPDEIDTITEFQDSTGLVIHLPVEKTLVFE